jgi:hypothetical protein
MFEAKFINIRLIKSEFLRLFIGSMLSAVTLFYVGFLEVAYSQNLPYSDPFLISTDTTMISTMAASALDNNGKLHIIFVGWYYEPESPDGVASEIFYTNNLNGKFMEPVKLPKAEIPFPPSRDDFYYSKEPSIAVSSSGTVHVAYYRTEFQLDGAGWLCYTNNKNGDFSVPQVLYYDPLVPDSKYYSGDVQNIMLASGTDNDSIHVVFEGNPGTHHGGARYSVGFDGNFTVPRTITEKSGDPTIKIDNEGIPTIVYWIYSDTTDITSHGNLAISKILGGRFSLPIILFESADPLESTFAIDQYDSVHVVVRHNAQIARIPQMYYIKGIAGQYTSPTPLSSHTLVSHMYGIDIGTNQTVYIAYKQAADFQSLGFMYNDGSGFRDVSPSDHVKYGFISAGPQWFTLDKDNNVAYFVYTTGQIYMVTVDLNTLTGIKDVIDPLKSFDYSLYQNYPNPFNSATTIKYNLRKPAKVILKIYNLSGQEIETLINDFQTTGDHEIIWQPQGLPSGIYLYKLQAGTFSATNKLILQK